MHDIQYTNRAAKAVWRLSMRTTWRKPRAKGLGDLDTQERKSLPDNVYAFPKQRKAPLTDASHVRNALARFDQVSDVSDEDRDLAFANIKKAAKEFGVEVAEKSWKDLGKKPHTANPSH
jgi:hypothetical protein